MPSREDYVEKGRRVVWGKVRASREKDFETVTQTLLENSKGWSRVRVWKVWRVRRFGMRR